MQIRAAIAATFAVVALSSANVEGQSPAKAPASAAYRVLAPVKLYPGVAPGSEAWKSPEKILGAVPSRILQNVVTPDYVAYLPDAARNTGTAVIIAPGGGFVMLSYDSEGVEVAKWLAERGIAAFVLKYRVRQTDPAQHPIQALFGNRAGGPGPTTPPAPPAPGAPAPINTSMDTTGQYGIADGILAVKTIRARAAEYGIKPDKIVMMGFSAGAMVTTGTLLQTDVASRPNYAAPIYGGPFGVMPAIRKGLPPIFLAVAQDDTTAGGAVESFYQALTAAGYKPEFHRFQSGGHGFGMNLKFTTSDHWIDEFYWWLEAHNLAQKPGDPPRPAPVVSDFGRGGGPPRP